MTVFFVKGANGMGKPFDSCHKPWSAIIYHKIASNNESHRYKSHESVDLCFIEDKKLCKKFHLLTNSHKYSLDSKVFQLERYFFALLVHTKGHVWILKVFLFKKIFRYSDSTVWCCLLSGLFNTDCKTRLDVCHTRDSSR